MLRVAAFLKNAKFRELGFESASRGGLKKYAGLHFEPDGGRRYAFERLPHRADAGQSTSSDGRPGFTTRNLPQK